MSIVLVSCWWHRLYAYIATDKKIANTYSKVSLAYCSLHSFIKQWRSNRPLTCCLKYIYSLLLPDLFTFRFCLTARPIFFWRWLQLAEFLKVSRKTFENCWCEICTGRIPFTRYPINSVKSTEGVVIDTILPKGPNVRKRCALSMLIVRITWRARCTDDSICDGGRLICQNGGRCINGTKCLCAVGFTGIDCSLGQMAITTTTIIIIVVVVTRNF